MDNDGPLRQNCDPNLPMALCILANTCGYISNAIWFLVLLPQLIKNFRRQSTTGLSFIWASCNFTASLINLFFILDIQVPLFTRISGWYMPILEAGMLLQFVAYSKVSKRRKVALAGVSMFVYAVVIVLEVMDAFGEDTSSRMVWVSIVLWSVETYFQVVLNMRLRSVSGQSYISLVLSFIGKTTDVIMQFTLLMPTHPPITNEIMITNTGIPEIIQQIGTHLDLPHLFTAIRVCRSWNHALIHCLWASIDDSLYSWGRILDTFLEGRRMDPNDNSGSDWLRRVFLKYGHLIQHLHVRRREILDAVCVTRTCVELKSFRVGKVDPVGLQLLEHEWMYNLSAEEQVEMTEARWKDAMEGVVDSLNFKQAFKPRSLDLSMTTLAQMEVDWEVTREFWMLLRENRGLQVLRLDESLKGFMSVVSSEYFMETLAPLKDLVDLENDFVQVDLAAVLQAVPDLRRYAKAPVLDANDTETLTDDSPSQLQRLQISMLMNIDGHLLDTVLPWIPDLRTLHLTRLYGRPVRSIVEHCSALTTIEGSNMGPIVQVIPGRRQENLEAGALEEMIMACPTLEKIDWIGKTLCETSLWDYTGVWPNLTYLRCQIGGLRVHTAEDEAIWKHIKHLPGPFRLEEQRVFEQQELIRQQQRLVLRRIGALRNLRTLDIGADFQLHENTSWRNGGQGGSWVDRKRPQMYDCLRLSLEMGLDELAGLKNLEVFGFEGIEHEIDEAELGWMSEKWSKLRVMHGLCRSGGLLLEEETEKDLKRERMLGVMKGLRPDVVHEPSGVCIMMPLA
ncbi:hypothetical protein BGZ90_001684 [Linnemannia elongata]|nr:hypothetical protein BGZ90_001684 [Linnemannia elongata]